MEAIREAAGVSKPTLYNHYAGKEGLFADVLAEIIDEIAGDWLPAAAAGAVSLTSVQELHEILTGLAHGAVAGLMRPEYLALVRLVVAEMPLFPQLGEIFRAVGPQRGLNTVATILEHAAAHGVVSVANPDAAARLFLGQLLTYVFIDGLLVADVPRKPSPAQIETMVALFMKAIS